RRRGTCISRSPREVTIMFTRRRIGTAVALCLSLSSTFAIIGNATAETYPSRPVRLVVGFPAGSAPDVLARLMGQWLSERLGQPFVIENRPGMGGNIATEAVVRARADGYTLLQVGLSNAFSASLYDKLNFDVIRDIAPVASIYRATG